MNTNVQSSATSILQYNDALAQDLPVAAVHPNRSTFGLVGMEGDHCHDEESDDDGLEWASIGRLFEGLHPTIVKGFLWNASNSDIAKAALSESRIEWQCRGEARENQTRNISSKKNATTVCAVVQCIDDDPGAIASGHYLWPSSLKLCDYLINNTLGVEIRSVLELGAGSGILSIVAAQTHCPKIVVVTDHDPTALERAKDNWESSLVEQRRFVGGESTNMITEFLQLEWGRGWPKVNNCLGKPTLPTLPTQFDLILGADLIDRKEIVEPLFCTMDTALQDNGVFLLSQSFVYDSETEDEIDRICKRFRLGRRLLAQNDEIPHPSNDGPSTNFVKIQQFRRRFN